jgi:hypothetical protein
MSADCKIASLLYTGLAGSFLSNVNNPSSQPSSRARARGADELSEFFSGPLKPRRTGLFGRDWLDLTTGRRWRATRLELREAYRLWAKHSDIRTGRFEEAKSFPDQDTRRW